MKNNNKIASTRKILQQVITSVSTIALTTQLALAGQIDYDHEQENSAMSSIQNTLANNLKIALTDLPIELQTKEKWLALQALWQKLNAIEPKTQGTSPFDGQSLVLQDNTTVFQQYGFFRSVNLPKYEQRRYHQVLSQEQAKILYEELSQIFSTRDVRQLSDEAKLLFRLISLRIEALSSHSYNLTEYEVEAVEIDRTELSMTRMAPPLSFKLSPVSPTYYLINAIDRIQMRANLLVELHADNEINSQVYTSTLEALLLDAKLVLYLDTLTNHSSRLFWYQLFQTDETISFPQNAVLRFEPEDFQSDHNLRDVQTWQNAASIAYQRQKKRILSNNSIPKDVSESLELLLDELTALREKLDKLLPILANMES